MEIIGTLLEIIGAVLLLSGATVIIVVLSGFSLASPDRHWSPLMQFLRLLRGRGDTPQGQRVRAWLEIALWLEVLGVLVVSTLWFLYRR